MTPTHTLRECAAALDAQAHTLSQHGGGEIDEAHALAMQSLALVLRIAAQRQEDRRPLWRVTRVQHHEPTPTERHVRLSHPSTVDPV